jgi:outer membrane lipoprotein-sorting protein
MSRNWPKWMPAVAVPAVIAVGVLAVPLQAGAATDLPDKTPKQVLELAAGSTVDTFSGTLEQTSDLGLPELPSTGTGDVDTGEMSDALDLLTGDHTVRVYSNGDDQSRVQVQDAMSERNLIRNGSDVWLYDSADNTAAHTTLPADARTHSGAEKSYTPGELADSFLADVTPSTIVSLGENTEIAGRSAYELVLTPNTDDTLVGSVAIAVDSETGLPLSVQVRAAEGSEPAVSVAFTSLSLDAPDADLFEFTPPAGATVTEKTLPTAGDESYTGKTDEAAADGATVIGTGWNAVVAVPAVDAAALAELTASPLYSQLTDTVDGGRAVSTTLLSVLITDDGRVFAGSVPVERLQAVAAE